MKTYGDRVQFLVVYIREAHALDSEEPMGGGSAPLLEDPITLGERQQAATTCVTKLELASIPAVVDGTDDAINVAYHAWPDRLYRSAATAASPSRAAWARSASPQTTSSARSGRS